MDLHAQRLTDLLASVKDIGPSQQAGIMSGPGNQGTNCPANLQGQASTAATFAAMPRQLHIGNWGAKPQ